MVKKHDELWSEKDFAETVSDEDLKKGMKYFKEDKNEKKDHECKKCKKLIGNHNLYWHEGLCNECFFDKHDM